MENVDKRMKTDDRKLIPAVEQYGKPMAEFIKKHSHWWWWVPEEKKLGLSLNSVVEATLNDGGEREVHDLFTLISVEKAAEIFRKDTNRHRINYRSKIVRFFNAYFEKHVPEYSH